MAFPTTATSQIWGTLPNGQTVTFQTEYYGRGNDGSSGDVGNNGLTGGDGGWFGNHGVNRSNADHGNGGNNGGNVETTGSIQNLFVTGGTLRSGAGGAGGNGGNGGIGHGSPGGGTQLREVIAGTVHIEMTEALAIDKKSAIMFCTTCNTPFGTLPDGLKF